MLIGLAWLPSKFLCAASDLGVFSHHVIQRSAAVEALLRSDATESHVAPVAVIDPQIPR